VATDISAWMDTGARSRGKAGQVKLSSWLTSTQPMPLVFELRTQPYVFEDVRCCCAGHRLSPGRHVWNTR
jgi:hypothetical protein